MGIGLARAPLIPDPRLVSLDLVRTGTTTAAMYLDQSRLAAGTGLRVTWARSTAMLLTYAGLLQEHLMGPVSCYHLPSREAAHG